MRSSTRVVSHAPVVKGKAAHPPNKHHVPGAAAERAEKDDFIVRVWGHSPPFFPPPSYPIPSCLPASPLTPPSSCHPHTTQVNLKGSIYLLTLENEMLKKAVQTGGAGPKSSAAMMAGSTTFGNSATNPVHTSASLLSNQLPSPEYPSEIGDAFEMMRQKYTQVGDSTEQPLLPLCVGVKGHPPFLRSPLIFFRTCHHTPTHTLFL